MQEQKAKSRTAATRAELRQRFELGGYYLDQPHPDRGGYWYACRHDPRTRQVRRRSLKTSNFEQAKLALAELVATRPQANIGGGPPSPDRVLTISVLTAYLEEHAPKIASEEAAGNAVRHIIDYLESIGKLEAPVAFWTPAQQLEWARWCVTTRKHGAGYIERMFNVLRSSFNDACKVKIRLDAVGNQVETALMTHAPDVPWKRAAIAAELKIPLQRPRPETLSLEDMGRVLDDLRTDHLFRFAVMSLCTWARPQAVLDFDPPTQVDWKDGSIDLAPVGWVATKKRRPRQPLSCCLAGWLRAWKKADLNAREAANTAGGSAPELGLIVHKGARVASVKKAIHKTGTRVKLTGFSQYGFRHFMADQVKKLFRGVPREHRSLWMGHVVRDGSRTTAHYESDDPHMLVDVAIATDCVIALVQEHCKRPLSAVEPLLNIDDLVAIGARVIPKNVKKQVVIGAGEGIRTLDPDLGKVVLYP
jgi:integrase